MRYRYTDVPSLLQGDMPEDEAECYRCHKYGCEFHHIMNGTSSRKDAERTGAWVWLCPKCHHWAHDTGEGVRYLRELKEKAQSKFLETHSLAEWMAIFHKNYEGLQQDDTE